MKKGINNSGFRALPSSVQNNILSNMKYGGRSFAAGGAMPMEQLTEFSNGGTHEENGLGGIPQGMNPDGQMNLVEEGETKFDAENYIYSDSLKVDKELAEAFNLSPKMVGKTFADASKMAGRKKSKRQGDVIENAANEKDLTNLMEAQEAFKQARIEEKLQEIAELDPNALPTLMGQGQPQGGPQEGAPQGDPAMGGQMQEAPMDEQAMMEQQMMAEQQGGGQPSPEEMAMMEQQQNQMMGQQEGMMRNGGYATRSYAPGGFMGANPGMNMANAGAMGASGDPVGCKCANGSVSTACCGRNYNESGEGVNKEKYDESGEKIPLLDRHAQFRGSDKKLPFWHRQALKKNDVNYSQQVSGTDGGTRKDLMKDSNMSQNYANIDMDQYTSEQQELMQGKLWADDPAVWEQANPGILNKQDSKQMRKVSNALNWVPPSFPSNFDKVKIDRDPDNPTNTPFFNRGNIRDAKQGNRFGDRERRFTKVQKALNWTRAKDDKIKNNPKVFAEKYGRTTHDAEGNSLRNPSNLFQGIKDYNELTPRFGQFRMKKNQFGGNLMQSGNQMGSTGLNQMQGQDLNIANAGGLNQMNQMNQMGSGGKMCYGCGGKMHNYGGRMNGAPGIKHEYGATLQTIGSTLDAAGNFLPPGFRQAADITGKFMSKWGEAKEQDVKFGIGDMATAVASGAVETIPGASKVAETVGDLAMKKKKEEELAKKQEILKDRNHPDHEQVKKAMEDRANSTGLQNSKKYQQVLGATAGMAGALMNPAEAKDAAGITGVAPDAVTDAVTDTTGVIGEGAGFGNWSDINMEAPEMNFNYGGNLMRGGGRMYAGGGPLTLKKTSTNPDGTTIEQDVTYASMEELLADAEMVNKYGGQDAIRKNFSSHFSSIPSEFTNPIGNIAARADQTNPNNLATNEDQNSMISYINQMQEEDELPDPTAENIQNISMLANTAGPNTLNQTAQPVVNNTPSNYYNFDTPQPKEDPVVNLPENQVTTTVPPLDDNEVPIDTDTKDNRQSMSFKETPMQFAAKMAGPLYNIGSGLLSKEKNYNPDFIPVNAPQLDATQSINSIRRNVAGVRKSLDKVGKNPSQLLALAQTGSRLEADAIQQIDTINAKLEFDAEKLNKTEKQKLNKIKKQLEMSFDEAKRKSIQEGIKQMGEIATTNQANELAAKYAAMGNGDVSTEVEYKTLVDQLGDFLKKRRELKKNK